MSNDLQPRHMSSHYPPHNYNHDYFRDSCRENNGGYDGNYDRGYDLRYDRNYEQNYNVYSHHPSSNNFQRREHSYLPYLHSGQLSHSVVHPINDHYANHHREYPLPHIANIGPYNFFVAIQPPPYIRLTLCILPVFQIPNSMPIPDEIYHIPLISLRYSDISAAHVALSSIRSCPFRLSLRDVSALPSTMHHNIVVTVCTALEHLLNAVSFALHNAGISTVAIPPHILLASVPSETNLISTFISENSPCSAPPFLVNTFSILHVYKTSKE